MPVAVKPVYRSRAWPAVRRQVLARDRRCGFVVDRRGPRSSLILAHGGLTVDRAAGDGWRSVTAVVGLSGPEGVGQREAGPSVRESVVAVVAAFGPRPGRVGVGLLMEQFQGETGVGSGGLGQIILTRAPLTATTSTPRLAMRSAADGGS